MPSDHSILISPSNRCKSNKLTGKPTVQKPTKRLWDMYVGLTVIKRTGELRPGESEGLLADTSLRIRSVLARVEGLIGEPHPVELPELE